MDSPDGMLEPKHHALLNESARRRLPSADGVRLCFQLLATASAIDRDCAARLAPRGLSEGKFVLLFLLHGQSGGLSPHELAERAGVTRATVTGLLDGLERDGFLRREADEVDRRRVQVLLSAKGKAIATKLFAEHTQWIGGLFEALSPAERKRLGELLGKVWRATDSAARRCRRWRDEQEGSQDARRRTRRAGHQPGAARAVGRRRAGVQPDRVSGGGFRRADGGRRAAGRRRCGAAMRAASAQGISRRMALAGALMLERLGPAGFDALRGHASDTVRGWACFMAGAMPGLDLEARLRLIRPLADDAHFGVREWVWMALRPGLAAELRRSVALLTPWTKEPSERLRRFASESLRPRGVWCAHIAELKADPGSVCPCWRRCAPILGICAGLGG